MSGLEYCRDVSNTSSLFLAILLVVSKVSGLVRRDSFLMMILCTRLPYKNTFSVVLPGKKLLSDNALFLKEIII